MPECDHCGATFDSEDPYLDHLESAHPDDLGAIEQRRLDDRAASGGDLPLGPIAIGGVLVITAGVLVYLLVVAGGGSDGPRNVGSVHYHGPITVIVEGEEIDFSQPKYQKPRENPAFHFEGGSGRQWHVHAQGVTFAYAMSTLGIELTETTVTIDGQTYRDDAPGQSVTVTVNGDRVEPDSYVLQEGDHIRITATVE